MDMEALQNSAMMWNPHCGWEEFVLLPWHFTLASFLLFLLLLSCTEGLEHFSFLISTPWAPLASFLLAPIFFVSPFSFPLSLALEFFFLLFKKLIHTAVCVYKESVII